MAIVDKVDNIDFHNLYSTLISGIANWIGIDLVPRTKEILISTYEKSVMSIINRKNNSGQKWAPKYPFISVDPQEFEIDPSMGRFFYNYPSFMAKFASRLYKPRLYDDDHTYVAPVLNRFRGTIEVNIWASSFYEMVDLKTKILQTFGGLNRIIYPENLECYMIIPKELENYSWVNDYTKETHTINWPLDTSSSTDPSFVLIRNINQERLTFPISIKPWLTLTNISENRDGWGGGGDTIADHRLTLTIEWEVSLPTHIVVIHRNSPDFPSGLILRLAINVHYIKNPYDSNNDIPYYNSIINFYKDMSSEENKINIDDVTFDKQYNYIITQEDQNVLQSENNLVITIPNVNVKNDNYIHLYSKYGFLDPIYHYKIIPPNQILLYGYTTKSLIKDDTVVCIIFKNSTQFPEPV